MITNLSQSNPLVIQAKHSLLTGMKPWRSWFLNIRDTCLLYVMPHPFALLKRPLPRERFKKLLKSLMISYWEVKLRGESALLPSLKYFKPEFHSLATPHPILWAPGSNLYEVSKAVRMLSGRYRPAVEPLC